MEPKYRNSPNCVIIEKGDLMKKLQAMFMKLMEGRYGPDILSRDMSFIALALFVINLFAKNTILYWIAVVILILSYFRIFSKKFPKRYNENRIYANFKKNSSKKFKRLFKRIKDFPKYKYVRCPQCNKQLRLPRGKKDIVVSCPVCHTKFDART